MSKDTTRQWVNILMTLVALTVNGLANALPLNGQNTGEISDRFKVFFVPAGYVFAIWGVIYIGLIAFTVYQALPAQRANPRLRSIGYLYALGCLANSVWIFMWHYNYFTVSVLVMLVLLASLLAIYLRLDIGRASVRRVELWCVDIVFSVYLGWITVATIANVTDALENVGWSGWGVAPELWAVIMLVVALLVTLAMLVTRRDIAYALVIIWATAGIAVKHADTVQVANAAWVVAAVVVVGLVYTISRRASFVRG
jgi:hypothetical protein